MPDKHAGAIEHKAAEKATEDDSCELQGRVCDEGEDGRYVKHLKFSRHYCLPGLPPHHHSRAKGKVQTDTEHR